jgi:peptidoglycan-associated lipoprotein
MFETFCKTVITPLLLAAATAAAAGAAYAQASPAAGRDAAPVQPVSAPHISYLSRHDILLGVTYQAAGANLTFASPASFFMQGGQVDLSAQVYKPFSAKGITAVGSFSGMHTGNSGQGVPVSLIAFAVGPRYTTPWIVVKHGVNRPIRFFGQALGGGAHGFDGLYPEASGPSTSASSYSLELGGGIDLQQKKRRFDLRLLQIDWLRTGLPNATDSTQNTVLFGIGIVFHDKAR